VANAEQPLSRDQRRLRSRERILEAARTLFIKLGYDRTTIRAVGNLAGVDPALVMQHFGSKEGLFRQAVRTEAAEPAAEGPEQLVEELLKRYGVKLETLPRTSLALLRSMLTHPAATEYARDGLGAQADQVSVAISGDDARLRAELIVTSLLGAIIGRHLLELDALRTAAPEQIIARLRPAFQSLTSGEGAAGTTDD
jgi:AcrR family transcriptional regulator